MAHSPAEHQDEFVYPPPHPRRPIVLGLIGAVLGLGCPPLGVGLGVASIVFVRKDGGRLLWGGLAIAVSVLAAAISAAVLRLQ